jgi:hypothetical protein
MDPENVLTKKLAVDKKSLKYLLSSKTFSAHFVNKVWGNFLTQCTVTIFYVNIYLSGEKNLVLFSDILPCAMCMEI